METITFNDDNNDPFIKQSENVYDFRFERQSIIINNHENLTNYYEDISTIVLRNALKFDEDFTIITFASKFYCFLIVQ
jgi:hypothetical protein